MTIYRSKIGLEIVTPIIFILGGVGILVIYNHAWSGLVVIGLAFAFIAHMLITTYYSISEHSLHIKCGFLYSETINIDAIKKISATHSPLSSPAASLDRLEIVYTPYDSIMVSPKEKKEFIQHLTRINPNIEVRMK